MSWLYNMGKTDKNRIGEDSQIRHQHCELVYFNSRRVFLNLTKV